MVTTKYGHYQVVNGHHQVVDGRYQVVIGQYHVVIGEYQMIIGECQGRTGLNKPWFGHEMGRHGSVWAENQPKWILWVRRVVLNPSWSQKHPDLRQKLSFGA